MRARDWSSIILVLEKLVSRALWRNFGMSIYLSDTYPSQLLIQRRIRTLNLTTNILRFIFSLQSIYNGNDYPDMFKLLITVQKKLGFLFFFVKNYNRRLSYMIFKFKIKF